VREKSRLWTALSDARRCLVPSSNASCQRLRENVEQLAR
jgi:hypothetical protein